MTDRHDNLTTTASLDAADVLPRAVSLIRYHAGPGRQVPRLSAAARTALANHGWPGGEAELDACIQRALVVARDGVIEAEDLGLEGDRAGSVRDRARAAVLRSLRASDGSRPAAAARLGIRPRSLRLLLAQMRTDGVSLPSDRPGSARAVRRPTASFTG